MLKIRQNALILLPLNYNISRLGQWILNFSNSVGQEGFEAHSKPMQVSHITQTKICYHKKSQNTPV